MKPGILSFIFLLFLAVAFQCQAAEKPKTIITKSPDQRISIILDLGETPLISIRCVDQEVLTPSPQSLEIREFKGAYTNPVVKKLITRQSADTIIPAIPEKRSRIPDVYTETEVWFKSNCGIKIRAYNDGVAWRFITKLPGEVTILKELMTLDAHNFDSVYFGEETSYISHSERLYPCLGVNDIEDGKMCVIPLLFRANKGLLMAFAESDLLDFPGLYLNKKGKTTFKGSHPEAVKDSYLSDDKRSYLPKTREDYIAKTRGTREYPWRVVAIAEKDAQLLENDIVYRLASPSKLTDITWIKPGKVAWDWWNDWNLSGVPFTSGINTQTYKHYIDFAAENGLEYVIFDEGWSATEDLEKINPNMDMDALFAYAKSKNVRIILWVTGRALQDKMITSLEKFRSWGCAGIKMDFMVRDDQQMVNFYEQVAAECAKRQMLVDYHGAYKPCGFNRTYPNHLTREGIRGLENSKWSKDITPIHDCTVPFTRMFSGPMDYTPGAMRNSTKDNFRALWSEPMSQGTRCHELAKYVIFESPLQMLCDAPSNYRKEPEAMDFLRSVPVTWDETRALDASVGKYIVEARRAKDTWYLAAINDWSARELDVDLTFLPAGTWLMEIWADGPNAGRKAEDFRQQTLLVNNTNMVKILMAPGGGYVARLTKRN